MCTRKGIKFELPHIFTQKRENLRDVAPLRKFDAKVINVTPDLSIWMQWTLINKSYWLWIVTASRRKDTWLKVTWLGFHLSVVN